MFFFSSVLTGLIECRRWRPHGVHLETKSPLWVWLTSPNAHICQTLAYLVSWYSLTAEHTLLQSAWVQTSGRLWMCLRQECSVIKQWEQLFIGRWRVVNIIFNCNDAILAWIHSFVSNLLFHKWYASNKLKRHVFFFFLCTETWCWAFIIWPCFWTPGHNREAVLQSPDHWRHL